MDGGEDMWDLAEKAVKALEKAKLKGGAASLPGSGAGGSKQGVSIDKAGSKSFSQKDSVYDDGVDQMWGVMNGSP